MTDVSNNNGGSLTSVVVMDKKVGCEDCNNTQDPISLDELKDIPSDFLFKVKEGAVTNCFDIRQLYLYYETSKKLENPLTRTPFSDETLDKFLKQVTKLGIAKDNKVVQRATEMEQLAADTEMLRDFLTRPVDEQDIALMEQVDWSRGLRPSRHHHRRSFHRPRLHETQDEIFVNNDGTVTRSNITMPASLARALGVDYRRQPSSEQRSNAPRTFITSSIASTASPIRTVTHRTIETTTTYSPSPMATPPLKKETVITTTSSFGSLPSNPIYNPRPAMTSATQSGFSVSNAPNGTNGRSSSSFNMTLAQERENMLAASRAQPRTTNSRGSSASTSSLDAYGGSGSYGEHTVSFSMSPSIYRGYEEPQSFQGSMPFYQGPSQSYQGPMQGPSQSYQGPMQSPMQSPSHFYQSQQNSPVNPGYQQYYQQQRSYQHSVPVSQQQIRPAAHISSQESTQKRDTTKSKPNKNQNTSNSNWIITFLLIALGGFFLAYFFMT
jgi:hypothetical protein